MRARYRVIAAIAGVGLLAAAQPQASAETLARPAAGSPPPANPKATPKSAPPAGSEAAPQSKAAPEPGTDKSKSKQKQKLVSILGHEVTNREGDHGRVIDVLIDVNGGHGAVVAEFGGFMGIGSRKVAVEWKALRFVRDGDRTSLIIDITREQIRDAPEYQPGTPPTVLKARAAETSRPPALKKLDEPVRDE